MFWQLAVLHAAKWVPSRVSSLSEDYACKMCLPYSVEVQQCILLVSIVLNK